MQVCGHLFFTLDVVHARILGGVLWGAAVATAGLHMEQLLEQRCRELSSRHQPFAVVDHLTKRLVPEGCVGENHAATLHFASIGHCCMPSPDADAGVVQFLVIGDMTRRIMHGHVEAVVAHLRSKIIAVPALTAAL